LKSYFPRLALLLLTVGLLTLLAGASYSLWVNPEVHFWRESAKKKLEWADQMRSEYGYVIGVVGGSSTAFGIDAAWIEEHHGLPVANLGLHAGAGPEACVGFGLAALQPGDTLVASIEPGLLAANANFQTNLGTQLAWTLDLPEMDLWRRGHSPTEKLLRLSRLQPGGYNLATMLGKLIFQMPLYRYQLKDSLPGGLLVTEERRLFPIDSNFSVPKEIQPSEEGIAFLKDLSRAAKARGINLFYLLPWSYTPAENARQARMANAGFLAHVEKTIPILEEPELGVDTNRNEFADTPQHLTREGASRRSKALAKKLIQ
jgi:hypothetical protein